MDSTKRRFWNKKMTWLSVAVGLTVILLAFVVYFLPRTSETASGAEDTLITAFENSGAQFSGVTAQSWGTLPATATTLDDIKDLYTKALEVLGSQVRINTTTYKDDYNVGITAEGTTDDGYTVDLVIQSISDTDGTAETYLIVNLTEENDLAAVAAIGKKAESLFSAVGGAGETSLLLSGNFDTILTMKEKLSVSELVFHSVGGEILEGVENETYLSQSGYCPGLTRSVTSNGQTINMQIAMFDNEVVDETCFYLGTPLVFSEY
ncbi:MAG: YwmB family TATA-box binding protein [Bacillota bacterium]|nr:YwmB family TATA-box binding protein [Bacillota bacterium]